MDRCCQPRPAIDARFRRVLWIVLFINAAMFAGELAAGLMARSVALQADALDFLGDAANYAVSLFVLGLSLRWRASAALLKGAAMGVFGLWVIGSTVYHLLVPGAPAAIVMGAVGVVALAANALSAGLLFAFRGGDANMRSVWLCSRNDAIGNLAVIAAASGVFATGSAWPDLLVAAVMATLALTASIKVIGLARGELRLAAAPGAAAE